MGSSWALETSPVALTMLSSRGRSEGGALWGRRYVKKNLGQREPGLSGPAFGDACFLYANFGVESGQGD